MTAISREARNRFDKDVAWSAFALVVPIGVGLLALPLIFRNIQQAQFTLFLLSYGAITFAPSLDLGVARTAQRRIAVCANDGREGVALLVRHSLQRTALVSISMAFLVGVGAFALLPSQENLLSHITLSAITGAGVGLAIFANCQRAILEGLGAFSRSALSRAAVGVMLIGVPALASFAFRDAAVLSLLAVLVRLPFIWEQQRAIRSTLANRTAHEGGRPSIGTEGFMRESSWFALWAVLAVSMSGFDRYILIGWADLAGHALAVFLAMQELALRAIAIPAALLPALIVRLAANEMTESARHLSRRLFLAIVPGVVLACMVGMLVSPLAVGLLYPELPNAESALTLKVLLLGIAASAIAQFPMARLVAAGHARDLALIHLVELGVYLALAPSIIARFGAPGAAALWSGRIVLDTALLIICSGIRMGGGKTMSRELMILTFGVGVLAAAGLAL